MSEAIQVFHALCHAIAGLEAPLSPLARHRGARPTRGAQLGRSQRLRRPLRHHRLSSPIMYAMQPCSMTTLVKISYEAQRVGEIGAFGFQ